MIFYSKNKEAVSVVIGTSSDTWGLMDIGYKREYKNYLSNKYGNVCGRTSHGCGKEFELEMLEVDHIIPISMGGSVCELGNMQLLCRECHDQKTKTIDNKLIERRRTFRQESKKLLYT